MDKKTEKRIIQAHKDGNEDKIHERTAGRYIGDLVYGANDGLITTFAVVSAVTGAALNPIIILIIGISNLLADGFSMAAGDYLASKSEMEYREEQRKIEEWEVKNIPEEERKEIRRIYASKGIKGKLLDQVIAKITKDKTVWVDTMMLEELQMPSQERISPFKKGGATFISFVLAGFMPLIPYAFSINPHFELSILITGVTLFSVGAARSFVISRGWFRSGLEMLIIGTLAASVAYLIGWFLGGLI